MSLAGAFKLVVAMGAIGTSVALPFAGYKYIPARKAGQGKAKKPRIVLGRGPGGAEFNLNIENFFNGEKIQKTLNFKQAKVTFNGKALGDKDILCSPDQDENYVIMRNSHPHYTVEGVNRQVATCDRRPLGIPRDAQVPTFKLDWKHHNLVNISPEIALGTCSFIFKPSDTGWNIFLHGCKDNPWRTFTPILDTKQLGTIDYVLD